MVQSVKRALKVDANHPELHSCLIRLFRFLDEGKLLSDAVSNAAVAAVLQTESQTLFNNMDASQLNKQFLEHKANSLPHRLQGRYIFANHYFIVHFVFFLFFSFPFFSFPFFSFPFLPSFCNSSKFDFNLKTYIVFLWVIGAKLMYVLDPSREEEAVSIVTDLKNEMEGVTPEVMTNSSFLVTIQKTVIIHDYRF